jgi:hypothetical protein
MDLKTVKSYDNSWWIKHLETTTVYDTKLIKEQFDWLLEQAETLQKIADAWINIETNGTSEDADNFYIIIQDILTKNND